jgi:predicted dinucleotide-binding enzyme
MRIGVVGAGRIGGNVARQAAKAGHDVKVSFSRDAQALQQLATALGDPPPSY